MRWIFLLSFLLPFSAAAQLKTGPRIGLSLATISAGGLFNWNGLPKPGPILGWSFEVPWTDQASFLFEPMYIAKGSLVQNSILNTWTSVRLGYMEMPVLFKISTNPEPDGLFLTAGFMGGILMNGRQVVRQNGTVLYDQNFYLRGAKNRTQMSAGVGVGWDRPRSHFEIRFQTSISPFSTIIQGQNLVAGLHYTYLLPLATTPKKGQD
jgi:hypothetical protein